MTERFSIHISSSQISGKEELCMKRFAYIKKTLFLLFISLLTLSGCGRNGDFSPETAAGEEISTESSEIENKVKTKNNTETEEGEVAGSAQSQPTLLEVPVSAKKEDILYNSEDSINRFMSKHRCQSDGKDLYLVYGSTGESAEERDLYVMPIGAALVFG